MPQSCFVVPTIYVKLKSNRKMKGVVTISSGIEIALILLPIIIVGAIGVFVVTKLKQKQVHGTLGKKKNKGTQDLLNSLIPLGMLLGCLIGMISSSFFPISLLSTLSLGAGIGLLGGYYAYEIYSKKEEK
ncbi:hypothetical protein [Carnobacterium mobile]|uniref:hypothetical protein n=2 Tax=Carnobacterium mobile TaxID=2750 RepID=UPI001D033E49|nr:hypothetical protein [Carnobacterium mobile]